MTEQTTKMDAANKIVKKYTLGSFGAGFIPSPAYDTVVLAAVQLKMLHSLAKVYEVEFSDELGKKVIAACLGAALPISLSLTASNLIKYVPVYGWVVKGVGTSIVAGIFTYAVGKVFIQHFESGCTFLSFDPQQVKHYFSSQLVQNEGVNTSFVGVRP